MYAHLYKISPGKWQLIINRSMQPTDGAILQVSSKREARAYALRFNAYPCNF